MRTIFLFLLSTYFWSCERQKNVEFQLPFEGEKLVVYGLISNENFPKLKVYRTQSILAESPNYYLSNIKAELYENSSFVDTFYFLQDCGSIATTISFDKKYSIFVEHNHLSVTSESIQLPPLIEIDTFSYHIAQDSSFLNILFSFTDIASTANYYTYSITKKRNGQIVEQKAANFQALIADENFNGIQNEIFLTESLRIPIFDDLELIDVVSPDEIIVKLYHVSKEVFLFHQSLKANSGELGNQYSEQNPPWTNINGGYGYFGAYRVDSLKIRL